MIDAGSEMGDEQQEVNSSDRRYSAPALEKGLDVLELLSEIRGGLTLADIADRLGRTKSEIFRMVTVLHDRGYIDRNGSQDRYFVTDRLFQLGLNRPKNRDLIALALPVMNAFSDQTGYGCHLTVASGAQMVVVARVESMSHIGFTVRIGYRQPLNLTGSGHCLLTFMSERRRLKALQDIKLAAPWVDIDALVVELERFRKAGRVIRDSGIAVGVVDVSSPVIDPLEGGAVAALTSPYIRMRQSPLEPEDLAVHVSQATTLISERLKI